MDILAGNAPLTRLPLRASFAFQGSGYSKRDLNRGCAPADNGNGILGRKSLLTVLPPLDKACDRFHRRKEMRIP